MLTALFIIVLFVSLPAYVSVSVYDVCWTSQSHNSSESMPCGGGDIGTNRVGETGLFPVSTSHTTVRTVRYTAVH